MVQGQHGIDQQVAAHDLRSSLRAIAIYSDLLAVEADSAQLDATRIKQLCSSIAAAIDENAALLDQIDLVLGCAVDTSDS